MKTRLIATLIGTLGLLGNGAALAHNENYGYGTHAPAVNGGVMVWTDSYGNIQYGANLAYGAPRAYSSAPYRGHVYGARCGHPSHYRYERDYYKNHGHKHKQRKGNKSHERYGYRHH